MPQSQNLSIRTVKGMTPVLKEGVYVDPAAVVIGDVVLEQDVSVWPMAVIRADVNQVRVGARSSIQDGTVIHESRPSSHHPDGYPTIIGEDVTIGHKVILHGCRIGNEVLIGMGATVLDGAVIEDRVIVGAGSLVTPGKQLQSGYLYTGRPARQARALTEEELNQFKSTALDYVELKAAYLGAAV